ncbi:MAG: hypothetical protein AAFV98_23560, partial [Chloroflexota bacterium]
DDIIEDLIDQSGWDVRVRPQVNQQALSIALESLMPEGARISKGPSYYMDKREVEAEIADIEEESIRELRQEFLRTTDFKLTVSQRKTVEVPDMEAVTIAPGEKMEINQAYAIVRNELEPHGLYKAGLKGGNIVLTFITPQLGERHIETINQLGKTTGYPMNIHPHPNQQKLAEITRKFAAEAGWNITKGPSLYIDRATIGITISDSPSDDEVTAMREKVEEHTGYELELFSM